MGYYWGYYQPAKPKQVKNGIKAKSKRGAIGQKWWSKRWVAVLESFDMGARLTRGRSYARKGQVIAIDVGKGVVRSQVQGALSIPYEIVIELDLISDEEWERAIEAMASKAIFAAKLLSGEMPNEIEEAFFEAGVSLFPDGSDLATGCSCPDWANPCKHIAAVYYLLAEKFDEDPFLIFKLRGRTKEDIVAALRKIRAAKAEASSEGAAAPAKHVKPLSECLDSFWELGAGLDALAPSPAPPAVARAVLKRLGDSPFSIDGANLASFLGKAYDVASRAALRKAAETNGGEVGEESADVHQAGDERQPVEAG
ncbi:MAG: SWIM zinc finger family protein [Methanotrichaceae archaeon]|nr:SWIM zinc finger family protein [Methanotrichaceae archaeon]